MAGIYIHIPYCKQKCIYCAFYSRPQLSTKEEYISALCKEITLRKNYLNEEKIKTLYFGGGTPSILSIKEFTKILSSLKTNFKLDNLEEFTIEANPDDITPDYLCELKKLGINRLSIGIQSFDDEELHFLNRRHSAIRAIESVKLAQNIGFDNISIDLMYGLPNQTLEKWKANILKAISLNVQHISAYGLTYEDGTLLAKFRDNGKLEESNEELYEEMFNELRKTLKKADFSQYEISNFSKKGFESKHNSSYWDNTHYLGLGAAAHSYNGFSRQWNIENLNIYIKKINNGEMDFFEKESLTENDKYEDLLLTSLRTIKGLDLNYLRENFSSNFYENITKQSEKLIKDGFLKMENSHLILTEKSLFISDFIIRNLLM